jgi:hypothetical protein
MNSDTRLGRLLNGKCARHAALSLSTLIPSAVQTPSLPAETLREIFLYCMAGSFGDLNPANAPLALRRVSTTWRDILDSMPCLWSTITVTPSQILPQNVQVIKEWLGRSGTTRLLDISIQVPPDFSDLDLLAAILAEFMPTCRRWQNLILSIPVEFLPMLLSNPDAPLPALESLKLAMNHQPQFTVDSSTTRLRSVSLLALPSLAMPSGCDLNLAWGRITHLNIQTVTGTIDSIWDIFFQCPQLLSLIIVAPNNSSIPKIPFHRRNVFHSNILDGLCLHELQELRLSFTDIANGEASLWPKTAILDLRRRCLPPLATISIAGKNIPERDLVEFVHEMRYLERLQVTYGTRELVTPYVQSLLPQTNAAVLHQRAVYRDEVQNAPFLV